MKLQPFTLEQGLEYQARHLAEWRTRLNPECYAALAAHLKDANANLPPNADGYSVQRGCDLDSFIANWHPPTGR